MHVLYAGADRFVAHVRDKVGELARQAYRNALSDDRDLQRVLGAVACDLSVLRARVEARLIERPLEDFRIDFEDGYGVREPAEEDRHAIAAGHAIAEGEMAGALPPHLGARIAPLEPATRARALRTLELVLGAMVERGVRRPLRITLPKVQDPAVVAELAGVLDGHEAALSLPPRSLSIELMLEHPRAFLDADGRVPIAALVAAGGGRVESCHLGSYDLTAALGVPGWAQRADHPACEAARVTAQLALAGTGVAFVDGATTRLPLPVVRDAMIHDDRARNHEAIVGAMAEHAANVRRALALGIHRGWDLHPAQIPARIIAVHASYLAEKDTMAARLDRFLAQQARATATGAAFDDAATGRALVSFFDRGRACGALTDEDLSAVRIDRAPASWRASSGG